MAHPETVILYHGKCPDGFGGAYAAWKKFGDTAEYLPVDHGDPPPEGLEGRDVYLVDFCYNEPEYMHQLQDMTRKLVVLDHHESVKDMVERVPEHIYDAERSGATIAWAYFQPDAPMPSLLKYLEDGDLYRHALSETEDIFSYLVLLPYDFLAWDDLVKGLDDPARRAGLLEKAHVCTEYFEALAAMSAANARKVRFEGHEVLFAATHPYITMKSRVGALLYAKQPPFALVVTAHPDGFGVSIRGDGSVDVGAIAAKYGGGGHRGSAGFFVKNAAVMPWEEIE